MTVFQVTAKLDKCVLTIIVCEDSFFPFPFSDRSDFNLEMFFRGDLGFLSCPSEKFPCHRTVIPVGPVTSADIFLSCPILC